MLTRKPLRHPTSSVGGFAMNGKEKPRKRLRAMPRPGWDAVRQRVWLRAKGQCQVILDGLRCSERAKDVHHVEPRSRFGERTRHLADAETNLACVCRPHHDAVSAPYYRGRLVFHILTEQGWTCRIYVRQSKWSGGGAA